MPPVPTAEGMQRISNLAHRVEGAVLGLAAVIALVQATGYRSTGYSRFVWPGLILGAGIVLLGLLLAPHHGRRHMHDQWRFVFGDPQQRQHLILAVVTTIAGAAEVASRAGWGPALTLGFVWPAAALVAGILFFVHPQHGTGDAVARAVRIHRWIGAMLIATGVLRAVELSRSGTPNWLAFSWPLALLAAALLLAAYREPLGAFRERHNSHRGN